MCPQRRLRSAWSSAQSDQSFRYPHDESLGPQLPIERTAKTLIRLGRYAEGDPSLYWVHMPFCWFCHEAAHLYHKKVSPTMIFNNAWNNQNFWHICDIPRPHIIFCKMIPHKPRMPVFSMLSWHLFICLFIRSPIYDQTSQLDFSKSTLVPHAHTTLMIS